MPTLAEALAELLDGRESFFVEQHYAAEVVKAPGAKRSHVEYEKAGYVCGVEGIALGYGEQPHDAVLDALTKLRNPNPPMTEDGRGHVVGPATWETLTK